MNTPEIVEKEQTIDRDDQYNRWKASARITKQRIALRNLMLLAVSLSLLMAGAIVGRAIENTSLPDWWQFTISIFLPLTGGAILALTISNMLSNLGKYRAEFDRVVADAGIISNEVSTKVHDVCLNCNIIRKVEGDRWCRWRGPISDVFAERGETSLQKFFGKAREIDILTPNLKEIAENANVIKILKENQQAKVRMLSLHPECSAVYRRANDMGPVEGIDDRDDYSKQIRRGLNTLHEARYKNNLDNWEIKTYTRYPVIMIFRADDRFLLGFTLAGNRVRDQFHIELRLPNMNPRTITASAQTTLSGVGELSDEELGCEVQADLIKHFNEIEKVSTPWMQRAEIFKSILHVPVENLGVPDLCPELSAKKNAKLRNLIQQVCSLERLKICRESHNCVLSEEPSRIRTILEDAEKKVDVETFKKQYCVDDNSLKNLARNFTNIILCIVDTAVEMLQTAGGSFPRQSFEEQLLERFSRKLSVNQFEFEDLSEVLFVIRKEVQAKQQHIWKDVWKKIEAQATNWAR